jgi:hypothetical protein
MQAGGNPFAGGYPPPHMGMQHMGYQPMHMGMHARGHGGGRPPAPPVPPEEPVLTRHLEGPFFAIDVECVATGLGHTDRSPAWVAIVDEQSKVVFDRFIKPKLPIVSCLTKLTGITPEQLADAPDIDAVRAEIVALLPEGSVIVGQGIESDIKWLGLEAPAHYASHFDVGSLFRKRKRWELSSYT